MGLLGQVRYGRLAMIGVGESLCKTMLSMFGSVAGNQNIVVNRLP